MKSRSSWFLLTWLLLIAVLVKADGEFPTVELSNEEMTVRLYLPDSERGYYRGTRFDWSGIIERVETRGHKFYAPLHTVHDPHGHDFVSGPAEEFAMDNPMGFDEAGEGESFVKIGVGLLRKGGEDQYRFNGQYQILEPGSWDIKHGDSWVDFRQTLIGERGWAYRYHKRISLVQGRSEFIIEHRLENSGSKTIDINHYNHNFTLIDDLPYGSDYSVEFPFATSQPQHINQLAWFRGNRIEVDEPLQDRSLWLPVHAGAAPASYNSGLIRNNKTGAAVRFIGDTPISKYIFWAVARAVCPEPFIRIELAPGESKQWSSRYIFTVDDNAVD